MEIFRKRTAGIRHSEVAAIEASPSDEPYLPDNLDITVFFGGHTYKNEFPPLKPHLVVTDIFVPELPEWTPEQVDLLSRTTQGDKKARKEFLVLHGEPFPFAVAETRAMLGSNIRVTPIDIPAGDSRADEIAEHFSQRATHSGVLPVVVHSLRKSLDNIIALADKEAQIESYRETLMFQSIGPRLESLIQSDSELSSKDRLSILIQLGTYHTYLYHLLSDLAKADPTVTIKRVFQEQKPIIFNHFDRITRAERAGITLSTEEKRELALRSIGRAGLSLNAIPLVIENKDYSSGRLVLPAADAMVDRFPVEAIRKFQKEIANINIEEGC